MTFNKYITVLMYILILILIPIILDFLFKITVRTKRKNAVIKLAEQDAYKNDKSLVVFENLDSGYVVTFEKKYKIEKFTGNIESIINEMADDSCVIVLNQILEYIDSDTLEQFIKKLYNISGGHIYFINLEKNSPKIFWDYRIKNIMNYPVYFPDSKIKWNKPNKLQNQIQKIYSYIFMIVPDNLFMRL